MVDYRVFLVEDAYAPNSPGGLNIAMSLAIKYNSASMWSLC